MESETKRKLRKAVKEESKNDNFLKKKKELRKKEFQDKAIGWLFIYIFITGYLSNILLFLYLIYRYLF